MPGRFGGVAACPGRKRAVRGVGIRDRSSAISSRMLEWTVESMMGQMGLWRNFVAAGGGWFSESFVLAENLSLGGNVDGA